MKDFNYWKKLHESEKLEEFSKDSIGLLWLKTKSIIRSSLIKIFCNENNLTLVGKDKDAKFSELFKIFSLKPEKYNVILDAFSKKENTRHLNSLNIQTITSELYKLKTFDWGGDYKNSLDKYLVTRYVKVQTPSYDRLISKFETEINIAVQGYVLNSWYNHWSSILIEHIFKSHPSVLPTIGKIKSVDFIISDVPFDLKVTHLPTEYLTGKREEKYTLKACDIALAYSNQYQLGFKIPGGKDNKKILKSFLKSLSKEKSKKEDLKIASKAIKEILAQCNERRFLTKKAKEAKISYVKKAKPADTFYEIVEKMKDRNDDFCNTVLTTLKNEKLEILKEVQDNPKILATWLFENQGEMRFGSENRLFLVLVDTDNFNDSWKLKRNLDLLKPTILSYLDDFKNKKIADLKVKFKFKGKPQTFTALADIIFVVK